MYKQIWLPAALVMALAGTALGAPNGSHAVIRPVPPNPGPSPAPHITPGIPVTAIMGPNQAVTPSTNTVTTPNPNGATTNPNPGGVVDPTTGQFVPFGSIDPATGLIITPNGQFGSGINQIPAPTPGFTFVPGTGGFIGNSGFFGNSAPFLPYGRTTLDIGGFVPQGNLYPLASVPTAGLNAPPLGRATNGYRGYGSYGRVPQRVSSTQRGTSATVSTSHTRSHVLQIENGDTDPEQVSLVDYAGDIMKSRPLREAKIIELGATKVRARYLVSGEPVVESFPVNNVFFFRTDGRMESVATAPAMVRVGESVLVPEPRSTEEPRQSVAGYRSEISSQTTAPEVTVRSKVAGNRERARTRRPAE